MRENFIIAERYKLQYLVSYHFVFTVNYIHDKNALYWILLCITKHRSANYILSLYIKVIKIII